VLGKIIIEGGYMPKDSLEEISGVNSEFEGKIIKPILMEDWALMESKLRSLLLTAAYKLEDYETQQSELDYVRKMGIDRSVVHQYMGRIEIAELFYWSALKLNKWTKAEMNDWLNEIYAIEVPEGALNRLQDLYVLILTISVPQPKEKAEAEDTSKNS
jgi:hypothetical protein